MGIIIEKWENRSLAALSSSLGDMHPYTSSMIIFYMHPHLLP